MSAAVLWVVRHRVGFTGGLFWTGIGSDCFCLVPDWLFWVRSRFRLVLGGASDPKNQSELVSIPPKNNLKPNKTNLKQIPVQSRPPRKANPMPYHCRVASFLGGCFVGQVLFWDRLRGQLKGFFIGAGQVPTRLGLVTLWAPKRDHGQLLGPKM